MMINIVNNQLFFEIMCEKMPYSNETNSAFRKCVMEVLQEYIGSEQVVIETHISAYRLVCVINNCPLNLQKRPREVKGPKVSADPIVIAKFAEKYGTNVESLYIKRIGNDDFYCVGIDYKSIPLQLEAGNLIISIIKNMTWPEYMRWGGSLKWIRPIRRIVAVFSEAPILFYWDEAKLSSSPSSLYHLNSEKEFVFSSSEVYFKLLSQENIFVNQTARKDYVDNQVRSLLLNSNLRLLPDSQEVLNEILLCSESPVMYMSKYDDDFDLPDQIRKVVMVHHQKYVPLFDQNKALSNSFLLHSNVSLEDGGATLKRDASRALFARFKEASYFWQKDLQLNESDHVEMLQKSMLHHDLGSLNQQTHRLEFMVSKFFGSMPHIKDAARYLNIDLCMNTIFEIPELHGIASGLYAVDKCNVDPRVSKVIVDSIYPRSDDPLPYDLGLEGACLGFCVRLDQLVGFFGKGHIPKGSSDPFGLRRAAFGLLKLGHYINRMPALDDMILHAVQLYYDQGIELSNSTLSSLKEFLKKRLEVLLCQVSEVFGPSFVGADITWKEMSRLEKFMSNKQYHDIMIKFYKRLAGICPSDVTAPSSAIGIQEHDAIVQLIKNSEGAKDELGHLVALSQATEMMLNKIHIQDLAPDKREGVLRTLASVKRAFDSYCNFNK